MQTAKPIGICVGLDFPIPPKGAWYTSNHAGKFIGAAHRDLGAGLAALVFGLFWNSLLSIFTAFGLSATFLYGIDDFLRASIILHFTEQLL